MAALPESNLPRARVCHFASGRLRVKIPEKRRDEVFFETVRESLAAWDSVERVAVNPLTASVLVEFSNIGALFAENTLKNDLFAVDYDALEAAGETPPALTEQAARAFIQADAAVRRRTSGGADLRSAVFMFLLSAGVIQVLRGNVVAPAATLFWYAGDMLRVWDRVPHPVGRAGGEESDGEG
jgi:Heavy metal associated domain 2